MLWLFSILGGIVLVYLAWIYNRLVQLSRRADGSWSDIDVQLKRRWDLVPALVATVKGYTEHESQTLTQVVTARNGATEAGSLAARGQRETALSAAVSDLFVLVESYPELKAAQTYLDLHQSLIEIENNVQYARRYYNAVVRDLNTLIESFPHNLIAPVFGFKPREFFQLDDPTERTTPRVGWKK